MRLRRKRKYEDVAPDEILIDAQNLPGFDATRLEGRIERAIGSPAYRIFVSLAVLVGIAFLTQLVNLQIIQAGSLSARAEANRLEENILVAERGVITDRAGKVLAENQTDTVLGHPVRSYPLGEAAAHLVGYVSYPKRDKNGYWTQENITGLSGIEETYDAALKGVNGAEIRETDATGAIVSGSTVHEPVRGMTIILSIDAGLQQELYHAIKAKADSSGFTGGSGAIMDIKSGEIYALASYPSFDPEVVSGGGAGVAALLTDPKSPFLNRAISGLYAPGSVVKPFVAIAALEESVITPEKQIFSDGTIAVPNPYDPTRPSIFKDWRFQGWMDMRHAIAYSSDVYFYEIGGGYHGPDGPDQAGLGIAKIKQYLSMFGIGQATRIGLPGEKSGLIPDPAWKASTFDGEAWLLGDTYHSAIGQYGFQVTTIELTRAVAALAEGELVDPTLIAGEHGRVTTLPIAAENFTVAREGMRLAVTDERGTAKALQVSGLQVAGKTGTAQVGVKNEFVNSVVIGFFPYEHPRYAFAIIMERAKSGTQIGAPAVMGDVLNWIVASRPQMIE